MEAEKINLTEAVTECFMECDENEKWAKDFLFDYNHTSIDISDYVGEYADRQVGIYYSELKDWLKTDYYAVEFMERVVDEGIIDTTDYDFFKHIQAAQWMQAEEDLYKGLTDNAWKLYVLNYAEQECHRTEVTEEEFDVLQDIIERCGLNTRMTCLNEEIESVLVKE